MKHRLISVIHDKNGNKHEIVSTRLKFETYRFFHRRHDLKVKSKRHKLKCLGL